MSDQWPRLPNGEIDYSDPSIPADVIPIDGRYSGDELMGRSVRSFEYLHLPLADVVTEEMPPFIRLRLIILWAYKVWGPDEPGGWFRMRGAIYRRALLEDSQVRRRAVRAFEKLEGAEVQRSQGKRTLLRLSIFSDSKPRGRT